jgi:AmmeMemoRadiSam system protein B/AmmeMemoRadiSam system protein A
VRVLEKMLIYLLIILLLGSFVAIFYSLIKKSRTETQSTTNTDTNTKSNERTIRHPFVAGSFYPEDSTKLNNELNDLLSKAKGISEIKPRILIAPHAGINYSGQVAASGFKQLEGFNYKKVILIGPSHNSFIDYAAIDPEGVWETPLGKVSIDNQLTSYLINNTENIKADATTHLKEHSLEVELLFLQKILKDFTIVPILVSDPNEDLTNSLAQRITDIFDEDTLLVISSDLSHYPNWEIANYVDNRTIDSILTGDITEFNQTLNKLHQEHLSNLATTACGAGAIKIGLAVGKNLKITEYKKIAYQNSGDIMGDKTKVVGYTTITAGKKSLNNPSIELTKEAEKEALAIARNTLNQYLSRQEIEDISPENSDLLKPLGAFVTLRNSGNLRGCIGEFEPTEPLYKVIKRTVIKAAVNDNRFLPVSFSELKDINIEITVMSPRTKIDIWQEINLGIDGVVIENGSHAGTFLPQVAKETGWSLEQFLEELCVQKAGLAKTCYMDPKTTLYTFNTSIFKE